MIQHVCRQCGRTFDGGPRAWYCPACRAERAAQHNREYKARQRAGTTRRLGTTAYCEVCGKPYTVNGSLQRFCPECAPAHLKQADNAQSLEWKRLHPEKVKAANAAFMRRNNGRSRKITWANSLRALRLKAGLTQQQLGELIGSNQTKISAWERGARKPSPKNLEKLAKALKVDASDIECNNNSWLLP